MSEGLAAGKKTDRKNRQKDVEAKRGGKWIIAALVVICLIVAAGFGVWKYTDSKKILLPSKATYTYDDGSSSKIVWNYDKISKTADGNIKVTGTVKNNGEYIPVEYDYNKDKKSICERENFSEIHQKWLSIITYTYDKKGNITKKKTENYSYETGEIEDVTESKYNKYGVEQTGQKIKYTEKDLFGRPKKAISGKKGAGHQEYNLKKGRVVKRKDYAPDGTLVYEAKYYGDGHVIETSTYSDDGTLTRHFKREDKKYKIKNTEKNEQAAVEKEQENGQEKEKEEKPKKGKVYKLGETVTYDGIKYKVTKNVYRYPDAVNEDAEDYVVSLEMENVDRADTEVNNLFDTLDWKLGYGPSDDRESLNSADDYIYEGRIDSSTALAFNEQILEKGTSIEGTILFENVPFEEPWIQGYPAPTLDIYDNTDDGKLSKIFSMEIW